MCGILRRLLEEEGCRRLPMVSVVVFNDRLKRLQVRKKGRDVIVCKSRRAAGKINRRLRHMETVLDDEQLEKIYELLKEQTRPFCVRRGRKEGGQASEAAGKFLKIILTKPERCGIIIPAFKYWAIAKW